MRKYSLLKYSLLLLLNLLFLTSCGGTPTQEASTAGKITENEDVSYSDDGYSEDDRSIVTLSIFVVTDEINQAVVAFNQSNSEYYVEIQTGEKGMTAEEFWEREMIEISIGKGPDIFTKTQQSTFNTYIQKNAIEDLTPYIERDLTPEDYLESSLYAYAKDGRVYALESCFELNLLVGSENSFGNKEGLTFAEAKTIMDAHPELPVFCNYYSDAGAFLRNFLVYGNPSYTDYETLRECILFDKTYEKRLTANEKAIPGETVLVESINLSNALDWADYEALYNRALTPVGNINQVNTGVLHSSFGWSINASSKQKEGAWAFLRFLLSEDYQRKYVTTFSPLKVLLEEQLAFYQQPIPHTYYDEALGEEITLLQNHTLRRTTNATHITAEYIAEYGTASIEISGMSEKQLETVRRLIDRSHTVCFSHDEAAHTIIFEEAQYYFNNERSLDDVMKNIENRMNLYMAEKQ